MDRQPTRTGRTSRVLLCTVASLAFTVLSPARADPGGPTAQVRVEVLQRGTLNQDVRALGSVRIGASQARAVSFARDVDVTRVFVRAGQRVQRGQPLVAVVGVPGGDLGYVQAQEAERFARSDLARLRRLAGQQLATQSQVEAARKALADAKAQLAAADAQHLQRNAATRVAPFDALVTAVQATVGARLAAGSTAVVLAPLSGLEAVVGVSPDVARQLHVGERAALHAVFDPDQRAPAVVRSAAGMVDARSHLVDVRLHLDAAPAAWLPGTPVEAAFALHPWSGWVVPRQAVLRDAAGQAYVFQDDGGKALRVDVSLEMDTPARSGIAGPLKPGLPIVVLGNDELADGMTLRVRR